MRNPTSKLSKLQKSILRRLLNYVRRRRAEGLKKSARGLPRGVFLIPMKWLRAKADKTKSESAAFSRALRSLEKRGLVVRSNVRTGIHRGRRRGEIRVSLKEPVPLRSDHVILTPEGEATAAGPRL